ncbi:translocation/assembly module TamB domain-containing protein [Oceanisphaera pacifica]|uniref:Translocation/assembly module TamB n=1 Tax=Oceanisphaera pacifica TaxID=2818389 RepID=A0ABS3NGS9_9GAMM|nr:translocation/assembly module TamB domain-containing protein [Oceanisphaera pacifica]MBO1519789.1 translocation/assembly module TamB [Oceanisphaera pacifica]
MMLTRIISTFVVSVCLLLMLVFSLLFTQTGNQWLWGIAKEQVSGLEGTLESGQLGQGWHFSELRFEQDSLAFSARDITLGWQLGKLLERRFWLQELVAEDIEVTIKDFAEAKEEEPTEPLGQFSPPVRVDLDNIQANNVKISLPGQTIAWQRLQVAMHWDNEAMVITGPNMEGLTLTLNSQDDAPPPPEPTTDDVASALVLPEVVLPFPIKLRDFKLTNSQLIQNGQVQALHALVLEVEGKDSTINIVNAELDHEMAVLKLGGNITLTQDYPLNLALNGMVREPLMDGQLDGQSVALTLSDSLAKLKGNLVLGGVLKAHAALAAEPLDPKLPFDFSLNWQQLGWPFNDPQWRLEQGQLSLKGRLEDYRLSLTSEAMGPDLPAIGLKLAANGDLSQANIAPLTLTLPRGEAKVEGKVNWSNGVNWQGILALADVDPGAFVAGMDGQLNGQLATQFALQGEQWQLDATPDIRGSLRDYPLSLTGQVSLDQALQGNINQLQLKNGDNRLTVNGQISERWQLNGVLSAPNLAVYAPGLYGDLAGDIQVRGALKAPELQANIKGKKAGFNDNEARDISLQAKATLGENLAGNVKFTIDRIRAGSMTMQSLKLTGSGTQANHQLDFSVKGDPLAAEFGLTGSVNDGGWRGRLNKGVLDSRLDRWSLQQPWVMSVQDATFTAQPHCWGSLAASLCFDAMSASAEQGKLGFNMRNLDLARLKPFFPEGFSWEAILAGQVQLEWQNGIPKLNANISTPPGTFVSSDTRLDYQTLSLTSDMTDNRLTSALAFRSTTLGQLNLNANVADLNSERALSGQLDIEQLKLDWLAPLLPEVARLQGTLAGQGRLEGTLAKPLLFGNIKLSGGEVDTYSDMVTVRDFTTELDIRGSQASITGQLKVGDGPLNINGDLDWRTLPVNGEIRLKGRNLEAGYPGMGRVRVSPDMQVILGEKAEVRGEIVIPWARIEVKKLPESAVGVSSDVVVVQPSGVIPETAPSLPLDMRIQVRLTDDVRLEAFGLDTLLEGKLNIVQNPNRPMRSNGEIRLIEGKFKAYGQNLLIRDGSILFSGPLDVPNLRVEAIRNPSSMSDSTITVGVKVTGNASQPKLEVFSEPSMPQAEQLSYLLRGRGLDGDGDSDGNALVQSMLLGVGVSTVGGVVSNVGEALGLQDVSLDTGGSGDDTEVNISAYVLPGLQIGYGVGVFSSIGELRLRYELLPRLYLQAASGLNQAIDLFYRFEF